VIGFRVRKRARMADPALVERFKAIPVANISDVMSRMVAGGSRLRPMHAGGVMGGVALTVKTRPGDNLMLHKALDMAGPGDVIVCDAGGDLTNSLMGEIMLGYAAKRGVAGFVIDGAVRDCAAIKASPLPFYAAGVTHRGPYKDGPGEINIPVSIDGMVIEPGDIVLGDEDGILCVPIDDAEAIYEAAAAKNAAEIKAIAAVEAGTNDRSWVDASLKRLGCVIDD
jgi:regulator of RNase E activity RraA